MKNVHSQIEQTKQSLHSLISDIERASKEGKRIDKVEGLIFKSLLQIGKNLLLLYIELIRSKTEGSLQLGKASGHQNKGLVTRSYYSIFGKMDYLRKKYYVEKKRGVLSIG